MASKKKAAPKKEPAKKKAAPKKDSKSVIAARLHANGIPVPEGATVAELKHREAHWIPGPGWLVRMYRQHPKLRAVGMLNNKMYWLPNSRWAESLILTKKLTVIRRMSEIPGNAIFIDVPEGWNGGN